MRHITPQLNTKMRLRTRLLAAVLAVGCLGGLAVRLFVLMLRDPGGYAVRAADQQLRGATLPAARGEIYAADGTLLAASETCWTIRAAPREMADEAVEPAARALSEILELDYAETLAKFSRRTSNDCLLRRRVDKAMADAVRDWCRDNGLYLILDMHDAPGGQTGDNIDDSYGYPWLLESEQSQQLFCDIWRKIADYYKDEPVILGYELINEPIAPYFENMEKLNARLEPFHKRAVKAIREVDTNHIILIGGAQWNGNFTPFHDATYDDKLMYTCHRYGGDATMEAIGSLIHFRDSVNLPMYMGEIGHNTDEWQAAFCRVMKENNIGYTFWPYKKLDGSSFVGIKAPEGWDLVRAFSEAPRGTYKEIRDARPNQEVVRRALQGWIENCKFGNCVPQKGYIRSLGLKVE